MKAANPSPLMPKKNTHTTRKRARSHTAYTSKTNMQNKTIISMKTTDQAPKTKLNATQSFIPKRLVTLERSKLYHESKSKEFTRHTTKQKQPDFTYLHAEVSYTNDFSSESHEKYKQIKQKFQIFITYYHINFAIKVC